MFILAGPEKASLQRVPVVTFTLLGLIAVGLLFTVVSEPGRKERIIWARSLYLKSSYLEVDPQLRDLAEQYPGARAFLARGSLPPQSKSAQLKAQEKLDRHWADARRALNSRGFMVFGFVPASPSLLSVFTHSLFHHGTFHALMCMLMLYLTAPYIEDRWGRIFMPLLFFGGSLLALLIFWSLRPTTYGAFHGADAGVATLLGAYLVRYPRERLRYVYLIPMIKRETFSSVWVLLFLWVAFECSIAYFWIGWTQFRYPGMLTQIGAFGFGATVALVIRIFNLEKLIYQTDFEKLPEHEQLDIRLERLQVEGAAEKLLETFREAWHKYPDRVDYMRNYWNQAVRLDRSDEALDAGKQLILLDHSEGDYDSAYFHWRELTEGHVGNNISLQNAELLANDLMTIGHHLEARNVMAYTIDHMPRDIDRDTMLALLETARYTDPRLALSAIDRLRFEHRSEPSLVSELDAQRSELLQLYPHILQPVAEKREIELSHEPINPLPEDPFAPTRVTQLRVVRIVPKAINESHLDFLMEGQDSIKRLPYDQVKALGAVALRPIGDAPEMVIDLHLDDPLQERASHRILRIRSRDFDPLNFFPKAENRSAAIREFLNTVLASGAQAMPNRQELLGPRLTSYASIADFESSAYGV